MPQKLTKTLANLLARRS